MKAEKLRCPTGHPNRGVVMKKRIALIFLSVLLVAGCANQLRSLNGQVVKTAGAVEISDPQNDYVIDANIPIPTSVSATQGNFSDRIRISWQQVFYGDAQIQYHVYREDVKKDGESKLLRLTGYRPIAQLHYDDLVSGTVVPGAVYKYYVRAINMSSPNTEGSVLSTPVTGYALSGVSSISADFRVSTEKVTVTWKEVEGASFYYLYRAPEPYENVVPNEESFERLSQAFTTTSYDDYSVLNGGSLESGKSYYYYVEACYDRETVSQRSGFARGALLSAGAPAEGYIESVSQGEILNAIRVTWKADDSATEYRVYRLTKDNIDGGDFVGTEIVVPINETKKDGDAAVWYDKSTSVGSGEEFYYRVAAVNDYGAGSLSSPTIAEDVLERSRITGKAIPSAEGLTPYVMLTRTGFYVSWPSCFTTINGDEGYYLFAADGSTGSEPADENGWTLLTADPVKALDMTLTESDLNGVLNGVPIADAKLYFRVLPVNTKMVTYTSGSGITVGSDYTKYETELGEEAAKTYLVGRSTYTRSLYFEKKAPVLVSIKATEGTEIGTVKVTAELDLNSEMGYLYNIKLQRTCYYGDEAGVYPLSLPPANTDADKHFPLKNQPKKANTSTYPMQEYFKSGVIEWSDPMPDYLSNGQEKGTVVWDYATWDREGWKCILRQKDVDMRQFMKIEYKLVSVALDPVSGAEMGDPVVLNTTPAVGWPDLSDKEFAHLAKWMTDCALNTIWQLNIPRMMWDKTVGWLPSLSFSHNGEKGGRMDFNVGSVTNLSGSGGTSGTAYSDWNGYSIKLSMSMKVSLESNQPRQVTLNGIQVTTPLYSGTMDMQITVRDFGPFWGLWSESNGTYQKGGYVKVKLGKRAAAEFNPSEIIMKGTGASDVFDYQVHGYDWERDLDPKEKTSYPAKGGGSWHFTRINWPARPYPENNSYMMNKGNKAAIDYKTTAW